MYAFDLQRALAGEELITKDGQVVKNFQHRLIYANRKFPFKAKITHELTGHVYTLCYSPAGKRFTHRDSHLDLFMRYESKATATVPPTATTFNKYTDFKVGDIVVYTPETLDPSYVLGTGMGWSVTDSLSQKDRKHLGAIPPGQELVVSEVYHHAELNLNLLRFNGMTEGILYNPTQFTLKSIYDMQQQQTTSTPKLTLQTAAVKPANKELYQFLIDYAKGKGVPVFYGATGDLNFNEYPYFHWSRYELCGSPNSQKNASTR